MAKKDIAVDTLTHDEERRANIPPAELEGVVDPKDREAILRAYHRRNSDLDPQLVWRGKDVENWSDLVAAAPPLYIQEKVHPKVLIDDLMRRSGKREAAGPSLFDYFRPEDEEAKVEFYQHSMRWTNRMILGDSLQVMASLAEREGLAGEVQCIYLDPPYGIRFNSNFQWSTTSRDVKDGDPRHITREPEQVKAFRDTWRDGIHSYLTYLRDRLTVARDLLADSGSIFVQIGDENLHRVRAVMDEVFGQENFVVTLKFSKTAGLGGQFLDETFDYIVWFGKSRENLKFRRPYYERVPGQAGATQYNLLMHDDGSVTKADGFDGAESSRLFAHDNLTSQSGNETTIFRFEIFGRPIQAPRKGGWKSSFSGIARLKRAGRILLLGSTPRYVRFFKDAPYYPIGSAWLDTGISGFADEKRYVVQTTPRAVQRCVLMTTDPGDLVLDPTCGSGTTATVAEQWGRRWITIDTSRVALALARSRIMGARYPWYLLADSPEGKEKEAEVTRSVPSSQPTSGDIRHGFVYERVPHITLKSIANNAEIDVIWERMQPAVEAALADLNAALRGHATPFKVQTGGRQGKTVDFTAPEGEIVTLRSGEEALANALLEWEVPRDAPDDWPEVPRKPLARFWDALIARQREIDASIAAKAEHEFLYDKPYEDRKRVRVAGPFTVESLSPHRMLAVGEDDELLDLAAAGEGQRERAEEARDFATMVLENLKAAGVHQADKQDRITFTSLAGWPGRFISAEGRYWEGSDDDGHERRAGIFIGPEYGTVQRADLVAAAREAADAGFDIVIASAFNFDAHASEFDQIGGMRVLKARMNPDLHMSDDLKPTSGNLFVIFGEPDIDVLDEGDELRVKINGVDVFKPQTGEIDSAGPEGIACWFIDTDYDNESFFVRHAYFLGASDPYKALKTTLKAEIDEEAWETLHSDVSRPFPRPKTGRIAVKVINHLGDEVMKVFTT